MALKPVTKKKGITTLASVVGGQPEETVSAEEVVEATEQGDSSEQIAVEASEDKRLKDGVRITVMREMNPAPTIGSFIMSEHVGSRIVKPGSYTIPREAALTLIERGWAILG